MLSPQKILAIKLRAMGDTVLMTAPLMELRRAYPQATIHALVPVQWTDILDGHPGVDKVIGIERRKEKSSRAKALARMAMALRKEDYDCVVNFHASTSSSILAFATGAKLRAVHFHGHTMKNRYSTVEIDGKGVVKPIIERDMDAVRALGVRAPEGGLPVFSLQEEERSWAKSWLSDAGLSSPLLAMGLGASRPAKNWGPEKFAELAIKWVERSGGSVLAVLGSHESALLERFNLAIPDNYRKAIQCEPRLNVRELAAILSQAKVYVGNDSGPKHLAVSVGARTVTLFGPEHPYEWHPYPTDLHPYVFVEGLPCRKDAQPGMPEWCGLQTCVEEKHRCMASISSDEVLKLMMPQPV